MTPQEMHKLLVDKGTQVGLPKNYKNDLLVHDLESLLTMEHKGLTKFWWRLRESGTQFSSHSENYARLGWDDEQAHCYLGDMATGTLELLPTPTEKRIR